VLVFLQLFSPFVRRRLQSETFITQTIYSTVCELQCCVLLMMMMMMTMMMMTIKMNGSTETTKVYSVSQKVAL